MTQIVFLHVGGDATLPTILCRSIRTHNPDAVLIQCTDHVSPAVDGADRVVRFDGDVDRLMLFRVSAFAAMTISEPTLFLDTDMICLQPIDPKAALDGAEAAVCRREYHRDILLDPRAMNIDLSEYAGRTLDEVYPYLACAVICRQPEFWTACLDELRRMPPKFLRWFGDQEAMRIVVNARRDRTRWLPESLYACLADVETDPSKNPKLCHFKGPGRKQMMLDCAKTIGLI